MRTALAAVPVVITFALFGFAGCVSITAPPCPSDLTLAKDVCLYSPSQSSRPTPEAKPTLPAGFREAMRECATLYRGVSIKETASGQPVYSVDRLQAGDVSETDRRFRGCVEGKLGKPLDWRNY